MDDFEVLDFLTLTKEVESQKLQSSQFLAKNIFLEVLIVEKHDFEA